MTSCSLQLPSLQAWTIAIVVHFGLTVGVGVPLAVIFYFSLQKEPTTPQRLNCMALALLVPIAIHLLVRQHYPSPTEDEYLHMTWMGAFLASTFGFVTCLKATQAVLNQAPVGASKDLNTFMLWFISIPEPAFAKDKLYKTQSLKNRLVAFLGKIVGQFVVLSLRQSLSTTSYFDYDSNPSPLLVMFRGFVHLWFLYLFLSFCADFGIISNTLATGGLAFEPAFDNPLLESRCLREAWGQRWNLPVHLLLKRSVYIPARKKRNLPRVLAVLLTFCASGLLHEYTFSIHNRKSYQPGRATLFFVLMGIAMLLEDVVWKTLVPRPVQDAIQQSVPSVAIATAVTLATTLLFEPLFVQSWVEAGAVDSIAQLFPHVVCAAA